MARVTLAATAAALLLGTASSAAALPAPLIAFVHGRNIWTVRADGTGARNLTPTPNADEAAPTWSPDGRTIAFLRGGAVWVMNADGSGQRRITGGATRGFVQFVHAAGIAWSSTGRIAYAVWDDKAQTEDVVVANADGTDPHLLGLDPNVPGLQHRTPWFESLAWTPDGSRLLFGLDNVDDQWGIFSVAADGSGLEHLRGTIEGDALPRASPDGRRLVYTRPSNGRRGSDLRIADANGTHARWLTHARGEDVGGSWSPDGRRVVFAGQRGAKPSRQVSSPFDLFVVDVSTRHVHRLLHLRGNELDPQWQPG